VLILALDTSSAAGSAAVVRDGAVVVERAGDGARTHGERLPRELMALLDDARVDVHDIERFAVATGPGSFTGLRVGIATIQGLALAQKRVVVPVSAFEALAVSVSSSSIAHRPSPIAVWIDAHRGEVFATLYDADGRVQYEPTSLPPRETLDAWAAALDGQRIAFTGDGAIRYRAAIDERLSGIAEIPAAVPPLAGVIGLIAAEQPDRAVAPHAIVPLYVRRSDAELARDRQQGSRQP
jgi:tRNA threonylcarbamoyladenosine biosynthesis protein TsaB